MASVVTDPNGRRRISFAVGDKRYTLRLGEVDKEVACDQARKLTRLISCQNAPHLIAPDVVRWIKGLSEKHYDQLVAAGLLPRRPAAATVLLADFLGEVFKSLRVKPGTRTFYGHTHRCLLQHFGKDRDLATIGAKDADGFCSWLSTHKFSRLPKVAGGKTPEPRGLALATISRRLQLTRGIFGKAVRWKILTENPFAGIRTGKQTNSKRNVYVTREDVAKVLERITDPQFRLIIALSRYAGLRCPSEHLALTWDDVVWGGKNEETEKEDPGRITVRSSKTEHHVDGETRVIPLFTELRPFLQDVYDLAQAGDVHVVTAWRNPGKNLRTRLLKTIARAGVVPWPRLFHNLRASCETDLATKYPLQTVAKWTGHDPAVMVNNYLSNPSLDSDFQRASGGPENKATRIPTRKGGKNGAKRETVMQAHVALNAEIEAVGAISEEGRMGDTGFELPHKPRKLEAISQTDAHSDARGGLTTAKPVATIPNPTFANESTAVDQIPASPFNSPTTLLVPASPPSPPPHVDVQAMQAAALMAAEYFEGADGHDDFYEKHPEFKGLGWRAEIAELARILRKAAGVRGWA